MIEGPHVIGFHDATRVLDGPPGFRARRSSSTLLLTPVGSTGGGLLLVAPALKATLWFDGWKVAPRGIMAQRARAALALSRDLGLSYKSAFVLLHKLREASAEEMKGRVVGGEGKVAEVDGGYFGGYIKPANQKENRRDRRYTSNQKGKRKVVVVVRERGGNSVPAVFGSESQAAAFIRARIAKGTVVHADEAASWDGLHERFEMKRINHQEAYSFDGACTNYAEEYFSHLHSAQQPAKRTRLFQRGALGISSIEGA